MDYGKIEEVGVGTLFLTPQNHSYHHLYLCSHGSYLTYSILYTCTFGPSHQTNLVVERS